MADSHHDGQHLDPTLIESMKEKLDRLEHKAVEMTAEGTNQITAGRKDELLYERVVSVSGYTGDFLFRKLTDDPDCIRVSIGQPIPKSLPVAPYVVIRGDVGDAIRVVEGALSVLRKLKS